MQVHCFVAGDDAPTQDERRKSEKSSKEKANQKYLSLISSPVFVRKYKECLGIKYVNKVVLMFTAKLVYIIVNMSESIRIVLVIVSKTIRSYIFGQSGVYNRQRV